MTFVEILYIVIAVAVVVLTVTFVWLSNELISLIKSVKRSSQDAEKVTKEIREKVLLLSESLDRAGTAASSLVGLMEDAVDSIKPRREKVAESLAVISGAGDHSQNQQAKESEIEINKDLDLDKEEEPKEVEKETEDKKANPKEKKSKK